MSDRPGIVVSAKNLDYYVKTKSWEYRLTTCFEKEKETSKIHRSPDSEPPAFDDSKYSQLLCGINFVAKPGELSAILGPSGCGKTTFLNVLANRSTGRAVGTVTFNGVKVEAQKLSGAVTMLPAHDRLLPFLTVRETLMFTALLKMPDSSESERSARVESIMRDLGLTHVCSTIVGGSWKKGLSSGEMRRCSIAQELISDPSVLILDEPTSGLDAVLAFEVVYLLHKLAHQGNRTVIITLHQPRSSIFERIDCLTLMAKGRVLYTGPRMEARPYFLALLNRDINDAGNPADELIDIASDVPVSPITTSAGRLDFKLGTKFATGHSADQVARCADAFETSARKAELLSEINAAESNPQDISQMKRQTRSAIIQWLLEINAVAFRTFRNQWRNPLALGGSIFVQLLMGLLLGAIFFKLPYTYLPATKPIDIADPNSSAMQLVNSKAAQFIATGIDGQGTNPILDIILDGIDGNGSDPFSTLVNSGAVYRFANMMPCTHRRLGLNEDPTYANTDFSEYNDLWGGANQSSSAFVGGVWNVPHTVTNLMQTLQVADHVFYHVDWHNAWRFCRGQGAMSYMSCYFCPPDTSLVLEAASVCTGVPPPPYPPTFDCKAGQSYEDYPDPDAESTSTSTSTESPSVSNAGRRLSDKSGDMRTDWIGIADKASAGRPKRKLQAAAVLSLGWNDMKDFIPARLLKLQRTAQEYTDAMRNCDHPVCKKLVDLLDSFSGGQAESGDSSGSSSVADYGSVLGAVMNVAGALYFAVAGIGFACYDGLTAICQERAMLNREIANKTYHASSYLIGKVIGDFMFQAVPGCLFLTAFYFLIDVDKGPHYSWYGWYMLVAIVNVWASYGFAYGVSAWSPSMEVAVIGAPLMMVIFLCCSGFFVRDAAIPTGISWLKYFSVYRWGFFALMLNQFPADQHYWGLPNSFNLALAGITEHSFGKCVGAMALLGLIYRVAAYAGLRLSNTKAGIET